MQRHFFWLIFIPVFSPSEAQQRLPVFANPADSAAHAQTEERLMIAMRNPLFTARIDSLSKAVVLLREKAVRYRTIYRPSAQFTRYDQRPSDLNSVRRLSLAGYKGKELPDSLFLMTNLTELELVNTQIRRLPTRLNDLKALNKIALLNNRPGRRIKLGRNQRVTTLAIHDDEQDFRPRNYKKFTGLQTLDLSRSSLTRLPALSGTPNLKRLILSDNLLTLTDMRKGKRGLEDLVLTANKITTLPSAIGEFRALKRLNLNGNQLTSLPAEIGKLTNLEHLMLYKNGLTNLPKEIYSLENLRVIDLYYNQLEELDADVARWAKLEIFYVSNNRLFTLPENLGSLKNLRELYLHHNRISSIPPSVGTLDSLRVLRVNDNLLVEFPDILLRLQSLENLDIASNQLSTLPQGLFELPHLKILCLKANPLDSDARLRIMQWARSAMTKRNIVIHLEGLVDVPVEGERP